MPSTHSLAFYGTLCVPQVLARVIGHPVPPESVQDALIEGYARLHVEGEDYPAVVAAREAEGVLRRPLTADEGRVRGVVVQGLTDTNVELLDLFEGDEYTRTLVSVSLLPPPSPSSSSPSSPPSTFPASLYLWTAPLHRLSPQLWTFEAFMRDSAHRWIGAEGAENPDYAATDRRRGMNGAITPSGKADGMQEMVAEVKEEVAKGELEVVGNREEKVEFGRKLREKYWAFEEGWTNLNHGSYGAAPLPVLSSLRQLQNHALSAPDRFIKTEYEAELVVVRQRLADFVDCDLDDLVMVSNATTGVGAVLRSLTTQWKKGDRLLYISTTSYNAVSAALRQVVDTHPHLSLSLLPVSIAYPISHESLLSTIRATIDKAESDGTGRKVRLAVVDAISSAPGVVVPWERLCELFREKEVLSLVDGAHAIGQVPFSLRTARPDFFVSNCHKWLFAQHVCAMLYVDKQHQHLIHSLPTGHAYALRPSPTTSSSPSSPSPPSSSWTSEFSWNGTTDWTPILSVSAALDFRRDITGGEEKIREWCHELAVEGGEKVARMFGTRTMRNQEGEGELVASMINVELPLPPASTFSPAQQALILDWWQRTLVSEYKTHVPIISHNDKLYVRLSAQVYNDMDDFVRVGEAVKALCDRVEEGEPFRKVEAEGKESVETTEAEVV